MEVHPTTPTTRVMSCRSESLSVVVEIRYLKVNVFLLKMGVSQK